jgi:hypothetical protein
MFSKIGQRELNQGEIIFEDIRVPHSSPPELRLVHWLPVGCLTAVLAIRTPLRYLLEHWCLCL